jgi:rubrerythrin
MPQKYTGSEIVDIAIRIEKNGEKLYRALAEQTEYLTVKNAFNALANEEKHHITSFDRIGEVIGRFKPDEAYPGEYALYLQALVQENVFAREELFKDLAKKVTNVQEALELAIWFEKETLIFLHGIKDLMDNEDMPVLNELIMQEKEHMQKLSEIKKTLQSKA